MSADLQELGDHIAISLGPTIVDRKIAYGELTVLARAGDIVRVLTFLRDDPRCLFVSFIDICGVDYPGREKRPVGRMPSVPGGVSLPVVR